MNKIINKLISNLIKALLNLWYITDEDNQNLIQWEVGTKNNYYDFTIKVNRY